MSDRGSAMIDGTSDEPQGVTLDEAREDMATYLKGLPLAAHAVAILDFVGERGEEPFGLGDAVRAAGGADLGEVMATLSHLSQGSRPALERSVVFVDSAGAEHRVESGALDYAEGKPYVHPVTGESVSDAGKSMYMRFEPVPGLLRDSAAGRRP